MGALFDKNNKKRQPKISNLLGMKLFTLYTVFQSTFADVGDDVCVRNGEEVICHPRGKFDDSAKSPQQGVRRYADLAEISKKHWKKQNLAKEWDERKYWGYGCHCFMVGDRPMSEMGRGAAVDGLDSACRRWKQCQKCVRQKHGDSCIGEIVSYTWKFSARQQEFQILNPNGSCPKELGECDLQLVKEQFTNRDYYDSSNNYFYGNFDKDDDSNCVKAVGPPVDHECCGGWSMAYTWMATHNRKCCRDPNNQNNQYPAKIDDVCNFA